MPRPRAVVNTDPYELLYLARDVGALESNMVRGTHLGSDEYHLRSVWLQFSSSKTLPPSQSFLPCPLPTHKNQNLVSKPQFRVGPETWCLFPFWDFGALWSMDCLEEGTLSL